MKRHRDASVGTSQKGGVRQRLKARREEEVMAGQSQLAMLLLSLFAWGQISPQLAQRLAHAAYQDACAMKNEKSDLRDLKSIGMIGDQGRYANKCYGDLIKAIPFKLQIPEPQHCKLLFKQPLHWLSQAMMLPHELFACIYTNFKTTWNKRILPSRERLQRFWNTNKEHPAFSGSKIKHIELYDQLVVPLLLHGDDVPITGVGKGWCQSMTTFSWSSMIGTGTTKELMYLIFGVFEKLRAVDPNQELDTYGQFFTMLSWSFHWLLEGLWPDRDHTGKKCLAFSLLDVPYNACCFPKLVNTCHPNGPYDSFFQNGLSALMFEAEMENTQRFDSLTLGTLRVKIKATPIYMKKRHIYL